MGPARRAPILIVGASGRLGGVVARALLARGETVRAFSRTPSKLNALEALGAETVTGDLRVPASLRAACSGVSRVFAAAHAFEEERGNNPHNVDEIGNFNLIDAAKEQGVEHFVLTSAHGARADHPVDFFRHKSKAEDHLRLSGLSFTILRPSAFMEFWAALIGQPIIAKGRAIVFGRGVNPINFVAVEDVADFALLALDAPGARGRIIEIGGPQDLSLLQVVETFERVTGINAKRSHVPLPVMRLMSKLTRTFNPTLSRQIAAGVYMDTADLRLDMRETLNRFPMNLRTLESIVANLHASAR